MIGNEKIFNYLLCKKYTEVHGLPGAEPAPQFIPRNSTG